MRRLDQELCHRSAREFRFPSRALLESLSDLSRPGLRSPHAAPRLRPLQIEQGVAPKRLRKLMEHATLKLPGYIWSPLAGRERRPRPGQGSRERAVAGAARLWRFSERIVSSQNACKNTACPVAAAHRGTFGTARKNARKYWVRLKGLEMLDLRWPVVPSLSLA